MSRPVIIVAAHPDDEAIGLATQLTRLDLAAIVHATDGAPRNGDDIRNAGCDRWEDYARLRRREFENALAAAGASSRENICLGWPDQQASSHIEAIGQALAEIFHRIQPAIVFTHPYEGGHPDHDATAAAVHAAARLWRGRCHLFEFASYHAGAGGLETECFLDNGSQPVDEHLLTIEERARKHKIFACYASQQHVLKQFQLRREPVRPAPVYDFGRPPHGGLLWYERFNWGVDASEWRALAAEAFRQLGIGAPAA